MNDTTEYIEERLMSALTPHPINEKIYGDTYSHDLLASIKEYGFKGTIEITKDDVIISGHRRYNACLELNYETIPVTVTDIVDENELVEYLIAMNQSSRVRTEEQIAREYEVLKEIEERRARERQAEAGGDKKSKVHKKSLPENFPEAIKQKNNGDSRDIAAEKTNSGRSGKTLENSLKVIKYADELKNMCPAYPDLAKKLLDKLNNQSVNAAVNEMKAIKADFRQAEQKHIERENKKKRDAELAAQLKPMPVPQKTTKLKPPTDTAQGFLKSEAAQPPEPKIVVPIKKAKFNATNENIEWAKWSWNPVTGCLHNCPYCYARDIATRYNGNFNPEFHEDRLNAPQFTNIPDRRAEESGINNVFVCSMADLFGDWVDPVWIQTIIDICADQSQWTYLFLTKNPKRYLEFDFSPNCWLGASATNQHQFDRAINTFMNLETDCVKFLSCEPLNEQINVKNLDCIDWLIIGGRSRSTKMPAFQPDWEWVQHLIVKADASMVPIYFKPNLKTRPKNYPNGVA